MDILTESESSAYRVSIEGINWHLTMDTFNTHMIHHYFVKFSWTLKGVSVLCNLLFHRHMLDLSRL